MARTLRVDKCRFIAMLGGDCYIDGGLSFVEVRGTDGNRPEPGLWLAQGPIGQARTEA